MRGPIRRIQDSRMHPATAAIVLASGMCVIVILVTVAILILIEVW